MPPEQQGGAAQEARVRSQLTREGYEQPYGSTDSEIRQRLGITGRCADFVGYRLQDGKWLISESKGSDMDTAYYQLTNTMEGLLAKEPTARGKVDLHIYTSPPNYERLTQDARGLGGNQLRDGFLGNYDTRQVWHYTEIDGVRVRVYKEQG